MLLIRYAKKLRLPNGAKMLTSEISCFLLKTDAYTL